MSEDQGAIYWLLGKNYKLISLKYGTFYLNNQFNFKIRCVII